MIGLKRGTVQLHPHDTKWAGAFASEKKRILEAIGEFVVDIEHIGSTSVPGLDAKPIIDMSIGLKRFKDAKKLIKPLDEIGYHFYKNFQKQVLFVKGPDRKRTHYVHLMRYNGAKWKSDLLFRDFLLSHPKRVKGYGFLKRKLAKQFHNDREKYSAGKDIFIKRTIELARHF